MDKCLVEAVLGQDEFFQFWSNESKKALEDRVMQFAFGIAIFVDEDGKSWIINMTRVAYTRITEYKKGVQQEREA